MTGELKKPHNIKSILLTIVIATGALYFIVYLTSDSGNSITFHPNERVHAIKSGENIASTNDGGPAVFPVEAWWRFTVIRDKSDGWVYLHSVGNPNIKWYVQRKYLAAGWITADKYLAPQAKIAAQNMERRAAEIKLPSAAQLKTEHEAAESRVVPEYKMLSLIAKINAAFVRTGQQSPLTGCRRDSNSSMICTVAGFNSGSKAYVIGDDAVNFEIKGNNNYQGHNLATVALPIILAFSPTESIDTVKSKLNRLISKTPKNGRASIMMYPLYGSVSYHSEHDEIKVIAAGSPMKPYYTAGH